MCGSATLAMVMSRMTMIIAAITDIVIRPRCFTSLNGDPSFAVPLMAGFSCAGYSPAAAVPGPLSVSMETVALRPVMRATSDGASK